MKIKVRGFQFIALVLFISLLTACGSNQRRIATVITPAAQPASLCLVPTALEARIRLAIDNDRLWSNYAHQTGSRAVPDLANKDVGVAMTVIWNDDRRLSSLTFTIMRDLQKGRYDYETLNVTCGRVFDSLISQLQ